MELSELKEWLDELYDRYDSPDFIENDPIAIPHSFSRQEDIELSGFLLNRLCDFTHRTFNGGDCIDFIRGLRHIYRIYSSLGRFFETEYAANSDLRQVLSRFRTRFFEAEHRPHAEKHLSSIDRGAACKRLCMFLKWMVRNDSRGVDFGLWKTIPASALYLPLDIHTGNTARALGLLHRRQNDWRAVEEVTDALRQLDPLDPIKYDFALFGAGIDGLLR